MDLSVLGRKDPGPARPEPGQIEEKLLIGSRTDELSPVGGA
jgi:hypothetical protein